MQKPIRAVPSLLNGLFGLWLRASAFVLMWTMTLVAQPLILDPAEGAYDVARYGEIMIQEVYEFAEDDTVSSFFPTAQQSEDAARNGAFSAIETRKIGVGVAGGIPTVRLQVTNPLDQSQDWIVAFNRASDYIYRVDLVIQGQPAPDAPVFFFSTENAQWDIQNDVLIHAPITLPANSTATIYTTFSNLNGGAAITLETSAHYANKRRGQDLFFFAIVGLTSGLAIITAALMLTLRRFVALYYLGAVLSGLLLALLSEQYFEALFPSLTAFSLQSGLLVYAAVAGPVFALLFQRQFFADVGGTGRLFGYVLLGAAVACIVSFIGSIEYEVIPFEIFGLVLAVCIILIAVNGIVAIFKGFVGRWPFCLASIVYASALVIKVASYFFSDLISAREASMILLYAIAFESGAMALTMFAQVRHLRTQKEEALQQELRATREKLAMSKAMSHAAHDIQQPLASLRLAMSAQDDQSGKPANFNDAITYLETIVSRQLSEGGHDDPTPEKAATDQPPRFEVAALFTNIHAMFAGEAAQKGVVLRVVPSSANAQADIFAIMRIVSNLVANAIRNTHDGKVLVGCRPKGDVLCIDVLDTGVGIAADDLVMLQQPHKRAGDYDGSGLGLSIVNALCDTHGLTLEVQSTIAQGSRFRLVLPRA